MTKDYIVNSATLAAFCGVTPSTIANWRRAGMPCIDSGKRGQAAEYNAPACLQWLIARQCGEDQALDLNLERARLAHHQANKTAVEESILKGEVVRTLDVIEVWAAMVGAARAKLLGLPRKLAATVIHAESFEEAESATAKEIRAILEELGGSGLPRQVERMLEASGARLETASRANG